MKTKNWYTLLIGALLMCHFANAQKGVIYVHPKNIDKQSGTYFPFVLINSNGYGTSHEKCTVFCTNLSGAVLVKILPSGFKGAYTSIVQNAKRYYPNVTTNIAKCLPFHWY